jgi:hypothetical protein
VEVQLPRLDKIGYCVLALDACSTASFVLLTLFTFCIILHVIDVIFYIWTIPLLLAISLEWSPLVPTNPSVIS